MSLTTMDPTAWVRVDIIPIEGTAQLWQASVRPYADVSTYQDGLKRGGIIEFGDVERSLSDRRGSPIVSTFSFVTFDRDGFWRGLQAGEYTKYLTAQDVTFLLASVEAHTTEADPRTLFRGQIVTPQVQPGRKYAVSAQSRVGTKKGPFDLDSPVLKRKFTTEDFPNLPRDFENKAVPFLWGELSDEGTVNATGDDVAGGMVVPTYCGFLAGDEPTFALPPTNFQVIVTGSGSTIPSTCGVVAMTVNGITTATTVYVPNYPAQPSASHYATWTWDDPNTPGVVIAFRMFISDGNVARPMNGLDTNNNGGTWTNPEQSYVHNGSPPGDDDRYKNRLPPPPLVNTAQIDEDIGEFFCLLGHTGKITSIYASSLAEGDGGYSLVTTGEMGTGNYFDLGANNEGITVTINGHDYFGFYARGPKAEAHKNSSFPFRVNLCGWHDDGSPGLMIDQAGLVYQDVFVQLTGPDGTGFQSGARLSIPSFASAPTIPILQSSRFQETQDITKNYMGDSTGYTVCVNLDSFDVTWRYFIEGMWASTFFDYGENHHGQVLIATMDDEADPTAGLLLRERIEINSVEDAGAIVDDEIVNIVRYQFDWHPIEGKYRSGVLELRDPISIEAYGERPAELNMPYVRVAAVASDVAGRYLLDRSTGPTYPAIAGRFKRCITVELGEQYRVQHSDFVVSEPIPVYLRMQRASTKRGEVVLKGRDRRGTYAMQSAPDDTTGTNSSDATAQELLIYAFATDDDGRLPDGTIGSRVR